MPNCVIKKCTNSDKKVTKKKDGVSFFRLPAEPTRREIWCRWIRAQRDDQYFKANIYHRVCSAHFHENDFTITKSGIRKLKTTAFPHLSIPENNKYSDVGSDAALKLAGVMDVDENTIQSTSNSDYRIKATETNKNEDFNEKTTEQNSQAEYLDVDISDLQSIFDTPKEIHLKKIIIRLQTRNISNKKTIKNLQKQNTRLKKKNNSLANIVKVLKNKKYFSEEVAKAVSKNAEVAELYRLQFMKNKKQKSTKKRMSYSPALRKFAMTLNFYSPAAYKYVRRTFDCCLPHPRTLVKWYKYLYCRSNKIKLIS